MAEFTHNQRRPSGGRSPFKERKDREFEEKVLELSRVARVVAGGKRFRFRATVVIGDGKGQVGLGIGKGADVAQAVQKASYQAKKNLVRVPIINGTIPFEVKVKYSSAIIYLKPAPQGRGVNAGGAVRVVASLAGIKDIIGKVLSRSGNKINNASATIAAFKILAAKNHKS